MALLGYACTSHGHAERLHLLRRLPRGRAPAVRLLLGALLVASARSPTLALTPTRTPTRTRTHPTLPLPLTRFAGAQMLGGALRPALVTELLTLNEHGAHLSVRLSVAKLTPTLPPNPNPNP